MARPRKKIDPELVKRLAEIHCTMDEMASILGCSIDLLEMRYSAIIKAARDNGKMSLKRAMFAKAIKEGNPTMMIWLSKQHLGMTDKHDVELRPSANPHDAKSGFSLKRADGRPLLVGIDKEAVAEMFPEEAKPIIDVEPQ